MRVQLGVSGPRGAVAERRGHEALRRQDRQPAAPPADGRRGPLEVSERLAGGTVVCGPHDGAGGVVAEPVEDRDALGRRERQVERGHLEHPGGVPDRLSCHGVRGREEPAQLAGIDLATQPEQPGAGARPPAARLGLIHVVVLGAGRQAGSGVDASVRLLGVVAVLPGSELRDREHPLLMTDTFPELAVDLAHLHPWCTGVFGRLGACSPLAARLAAWSPCGFVTLGLARLGLGRLAACSLVLGLARLEV